MSSPRWDAAVIGGGHNGLACAALLAKRGLKVVVLERRPCLGGAAVTEEIHPGFKAPSLAHTAGPLRPALLRELGLALDTVAAEPRVFAPLPDGRALALHGDALKSAAAIRPFSAKDAERYPELQRALGRIAPIVSRLLDTVPPDVESPGTRDLWGLLRLGLGFRRLGRELAQHAMRWGPMAATDFVSEWFESEPLRAVLAARALRGNFAGPRSAGTAANLLLQAGLDGGVPAGSAVFVRGGPGALSEALHAAARRFGAEVRTGCEVASILVRDSGAQGVALRSGEEIAARAVVSCADPKTTFLKLVDPAQLDPEDRHALQGYRQEGMASKVNLALGALPQFRSAGPQGAELLRGRIHVGPSLEALERAFDDAKYGRVSSEPVLDVTLPSLSDPSLAPAGCHVMSIYVQYTPRRLRDADWRQRREALGDLVLRTLEAYAPGLASLVLARQVLCPEDIEATYGIEGGHPLHGDHGLAQLFVTRPLLGYGRHRSPIAGLYLGGAGAHPGGGLTGAPGRNAAREIARDLKA